MDGEHERRNSAPAWLSTGITACLIAATLAYGYARLDHPEFEVGPWVALLQSNLPQSLKMEDPKALRAHMTKLLEKAISVPIDQVPDLVVWPETTCSFKPDDIDMEEWMDAAPGVDRNRLPENWEAEMLFSKMLGRSIGGWKVDHFFPKIHLNFDALADVTA